MGDTCIARLGKEIDKEEDTHGNGHSDKDVDPPDELRAGEGKGDEGDACRAQTRGQGIDGCLGDVFG